MPLLRSYHGWITAMLFATTLALGVTVPVLAQTWEDELFGGSFADDLFGGDTLISQIDESSTVAPHEELLVSDEVEIGGNFSLTVGSTWMWPNWDQFRNQPRQPLVDLLSTNLQASLFMDARPDKDFRVFGKAQLNYSGSDEVASGSLLDTVRVTELFSDFNYNERLFFRVGKQNISWGVGYFMSPADIVNLTPIDPANPEAEREGRLALKMNAPVGVNNLYLYVLADSATHLCDLAWAPKVELVTRGVEFGLGGYYKHQKDPLLMATVSGALGNFSIFGEGALKLGDQTSWQTTAGFHYAYSDQADLLNLNLASQYLYNGDADPAASRWPGKHHLAVTLMWPNVLKTDVSANTFWLGNLADDTGMITTSLSWQPLNRISTAVGMNYNYGPLGGQYTKLGNPTVLFLRFTLGSGKF